MQRVVGRTSAGRHLLNAQAVLVVLKLDVPVTLAHALELSALLPGVSPGAIIQRVANVVIGIEPGRQKGHPAMPDGQWRG